LSGFTAVSAVFEYIFGLATFGFFYWLLNGILVEFQGVSETGTLYDFGMYLWAGSLIIYLIFGAFWLPRKLKEWEYE